MPLISDHNHGTKARAHVADIVGPVSRDQLTYVGHAAGKRAGLQGCCKLQRSNVCGHVESAESGHLMLAASEGHVVAFALRERLSGSCQNIVPPKNATQ